MLLSEKKGKEGGKGGERKKMSQREKVIGSNQTMKNYNLPQSKNHQKEFRQKKVRPTFYIFYKKILWGHSISLKENFQLKVLIGKAKTQQPQFFSPL